MAEKCHKNHIYDRKDLVPTLPYTFFLAVLTERHRNYEGRLLQHKINIEGRFQGGYAKNVCILGSRGYTVVLK